MQYRADRRRRCSACSRRAPESTTTAPWWWAGAGSTTWPPSSAPRSSWSTRTRCGTGPATTSPRSAAAGPAATWRSRRKSFPCTAVQRVMVEEGLHLDVAGGGEILTAIEAGADPARLVHARQRQDRRGARAGGQAAVSGWSSSTTSTTSTGWNASCRTGHRQPCLVRVIPGVEAATHASQATGHAGSKFGLMPDDARAAIARIERSAVLRLDGVHTHVGSQLLNVEQLAAAVEPIAKLGTFDTYDLGGGLGVRYTYDEHPPSRRRLRRGDGGAGPRAAARRQPDHHRAGPQHGRDETPARSTGSRPSSAGSSPTSRSTAGWATTSRCR